jgi:predicted DNA-binding protein
MQRTNIYLDKEQIARLDREAAHQGVTRAALVRRLLDAALDDGASTLRHDLEALDVSFGADPEIRVVRGPDARSRHLDALRGP